MIDDHHYYVFPNLVYNIQAGHFSIMHYRPGPGDHESTYFDFFIHQWLPEAKRAEATRKEHELHEHGKGVLGPIADQDFENLPTVQAGMHSAGFSHLTLSRIEVRIMAMHETIDRYLSGGG